MKRMGQLEDESAYRPGPVVISSDGDEPDWADAGEDGGPPPAEEPEEESPFLRASKRVPARRGVLPRKAAGRLKLFLGTLLGLAAIAILGAALVHYGHRSWRFRLDSSDQIEITGTHNVTHSEVLEVFGADISRNVFLIPLEERRRQLQRIPWVQSATVMRLLPDRITVDVHERTPVAYVQFGAPADGTPGPPGEPSPQGNQLIDATGVLLDAPLAAHYSFPVILGFTGVEPLSTRAARMRIFQTLMRELDSGGANYSRDLSEVDLSDPADTRITVADGNGEILIHLGEAHFLERYKVFISHIQEWRRQYAKIESVDMRYERQVILNPDVRAPQAEPAPAAEPAAEAPPDLPKPAEDHAKPPAVQHRRK
jgi:cell division protein FtsQ